MLSQGNTGNDQSAKPRIDSSISLCNSSGVGCWKTEKLQWGVEETHFFFFSAVKSSRAWHFEHKSLARAVKQSVTIT